MLKFRDFLRESFETPRLNGACIYNFGYLAYIFQTAHLSSTQQELVKEELKLLKSRYLEDVSDLVVRQIEKYVGRSRIEMDDERRPKFDLEKLKNMDKTSTDRMVGIDRAMNMTYRSDMRRRNNVWNSVTGNLVKLANAITSKDLIYAMDRLNNDIHNTKNSIFEKFPNGSELVRALQKIHDARTPDEFKRKVASRILEIEEL